MNNNDNRDKSSKNLISIVVGIIITAIFIMIDQWTKALAVSKLMGKPSFVIIDGVFELMYLENRGAAFGMLQNQKYFFVIGAVLVTIVASYVYCRVPLEKKYILSKLICVLMVSGAIGNMIDRCVNNYVIDFLYFSLIDFPVFNVADIYVTVGEVIMCIVIFFVYKDGDFSFLFPKKKEK